MVTLKRRGWVELRVSTVVIFLTAFVVISGLLIYKVFFEENFPDEVTEFVFPGRADEDGDQNPVRKEVIKPSVSVDKEDLENIVSENKEEDASLESVEAEKVPLDSFRNEDEAEKKGLSNDSEGDLLDERVSAKDALAIEKTRSLFTPRKDLRIENLPKNKIYYEGNNGVLESVVYSSEGGLSEKLVSVKPDGEFVDALEIGFIDLVDKNGDPVFTIEKYAVVYRNKISVYELTRKGRNSARDEKVTEYTISPQLEFIRGKTYSKIN